MLETFIAPATLRIDAVDIAASSSMYLSVSLRLFLDSVDDFEGLIPSERGGKVELGGVSIESCPLIGVWFVLVAGDEV